MIFYIIAIAGFCFDQIIKYFVIKNPLRFQGVFVNDRFALSIPIANSVAAILMAGAIVVLSYYAIKKNKPIIWIIIFGAISNFIDRIFYGGVIDYIHIPFNGVINAADIMISIGVLILIIPFRKE